MVPEFHGLEATLAALPTSRVGVGIALVGGGVQTPPPREGSSQKWVGRWVWTPPSRRQLQKTGGWVFLDPAISLGFRTLKSLL